MSTREKFTAGIGDPTGDPLTYVCQQHRRGQFAAGVVDTGEQPF
jgi:hypothetical protein